VKYKSSSPTYQSKLVRANPGAHVHDRVAGLHEQLRPGSTAATGGFLGAAGTCEVARIITSHVRGME
jgi:hypothetical protein